MANGRRGRTGRNRDNVQTKAVSSVSGQANEFIQNARGVSLEMLDPRKFLFHNAHISSGKEPSKKCQLCSGNVGKVIVSLEVSISGAEVGQGGGTDEERSTTSAYNHELWPWQQESEV